MTKKDPSFNDDLSIVPERDERSAHTQKPRRGHSGSASSVSSHKAKVGGFVIFLLTVLTVGLIATGGVSYLFYEQSQSMLVELNTSNNRIAQLENRLSMTDEAAQQSSLGLLERVDFNFSEIDKLWAARNQNRANITANKDTLEGLDENFSSIETVVSRQSTTLNENAVSLSAIQARVETLSNNLAGMDNLGEQLRAINQELTLVKQSVASQGNGIEGRVVTNEQDIESINIFRLQVNQTINSIQNSLNNLQQQVGSQ